MTVAPQRRHASPLPQPLQPILPAPPISPPQSLKRQFASTPTLSTNALSLTRPCENVQRSLKRLKRSSIFNDNSVVEMDGSEPELYAAAIPADTAESVRKDVSPFLSKHIPGQYAPQGSQQQQDGQHDLEEKGNTKFCYRHRPDIKCRRQADEPTMEELQKGMETLPSADQQAITDVWSLFSAAPATHRNLMLRGILMQCCFPQLSMISAALRELIRIDFLSALPPEIAFKVLCYLDTASLCKAAQVSHRWRMLADDDVVWHKMCEQHIDRKCDKCGWGLPLLERKRLRMTKRQMERRAKEPNIFTTEITSGTKDLNIHGKRPNGRNSPDVEMVPVISPKRTCQRAVEVPPTRPWKDVYSERYKVESNWRRGRCTKKIFKGHTDGIMCLQFDDAILATGSYDSTVKIWDIETGKEIRTLTGHGSGVRALMFDNRKLISGSLDKKLKIWDWRTGKCLSTLPGHTGGVICLHFNDNLLASGSVDTTIKIWNFADKSCYALRGHTDWVNSVRIDTDSRMVFSASDDQTVRMWDLDTKACVRVFESHVGHVQQVIPMQLPGYMSPKPTKEDSPQNSILPPHQHWQEYRDKNSPNPTTRPRAPPPEKMITAALDSTVKFWDVATGKCTKTLFGHIEGVWALAADSLRVISGSQDRMTKVWDVRTGRCLRTITGHQGPVTCVGLSDSNMVTGGEDGEARMYCFKSEGDCVHGWSTPPDFVGSTDIAGGSINSED